MLLTNELGGLQKIQLLNCSSKIRTTFELSSSYLLSIWRYSNLCIAQIKNAK